MTYEQRPTHQQQLLLRELHEGPMTSRVLSDAYCNRSGDGAGSLTPHAVHASMRRMEDRGWVRRMTYGGEHDRSLRWELTGRGRHHAGG